MNAEDADWNCKRVPRVAGIDLCIEAPEEDSKPDVSRQDSIRTLERTGSHYPGSGEAKSSWSVEILSPQ
jgi:hypothetical protein